MPGAPAWTMKIAEKAMLTRPTPIDGRHQTAVNLDGVSPLGAAVDDWTPEIHLSDAERAEGARRLDEAVGQSGTRSGLRVLVHPGAGKPPNRWAAERFGEVAAALCAAGHRVVGASGPSETALLPRVDSGAGRLIPRLASGDVRTLAGAIAAADLLIANDTGVLHLGAAVGVPVLALFGPTDPTVWCPAAPGVRWMRAPGGDLEQLTTAVVRDAALAFAAHVAGEGEPPAHTTASPRAAP